MGKKTDKKIKSERINALRKQYDSFLEEDKKRKERNDYILGRLDKMRYTKMAVQVHQTPSYRDFLPSSFSRHSYQAEKLEPTTVDRINTMQLVHANPPISRPGYQSLQSDVSRNYLEEASILNEISKKYILIPKLKNTLSNASLEAIPSLVTEPMTSVMPDIDSNDWKSKYDILKQLKNKEKEEEICKSASQEPASELRGDQVLQNYNQGDIITTYENEIPVKDETNEVGIEINLKENCELSKSNDQIEISDGGRDLNADYYAQSDVLYQNVNDLGEKLEHGLVVQECAVAHEQNFQRTVNDENTDNNQKSYPNQEQIQAISNENTGEHLKSNPEDEYAQGYSNYDNSVQCKQSDPEKEYVQEVSNSDNTVGYQNSYPGQEYPIEYEQFVPEQDPYINRTEQVNAFETMSSDSPKKPTYNPDEPTFLEYDPVEDLVDGNIAAEITTDNAEGFEAGIEEFDAEQRELFHSQNTDENNTYYDQGGTYNADYSQEKNYPESQEYAYYEGTEQGVPPVEVNENEETQQHYDPAYEQQYMTTYDQTQEEQQEHMEPDSQLLPETNYDLNQMQHFEEQSYGPEETAMKVEEVVAKEEGLPNIENERVVLTET